MILYNNKKRVCCHLRGCGKTNHDALTRENLYQLMFMTVLLLVRTISHMDFHIADCVSKPAQVSREFEMATYQLKYDILLYWSISKNLFIVSQKGITRRFSRTLKSGRFILQLRSPVNVVFRVSELEPVRVSSGTFPFWFSTLFMKKKDIIKAFKILKHSITPTKDRFSGYFSSSYWFLLFPYILSWESQENNFFHKT